MPGEPLLTFACGCLVLTHAWTRRIVQSNSPGSGPVNPLTVPASHANTAGMAKRKPARRTKRPNQMTLVQRLYRDAQIQRRALTRPCPDKEMNAGLELLFTLTASIASAPSETAHDLRLKIEVLCARLREHLQPEHEGELLDYLLADSIRDDLAMASVYAESNSEKS